MADSSFDAVIVGAGFSGLAMLNRARGLGLSACVLEAGSGVGGTWYWNRYPGARCDTDSMQYSYQFSHELEQEWDWTERFATQPEILRYANHVADRFDLRRDIRFNTRVVGAAFDEGRGRWLIRTADGAAVSARFCILGTGCLSLVNTPKFPGLETFKGEHVHTARWPREGIDFTGRRVGVIGTGSSAIQSIPLMAKQAERLVVFQRTPNYTVPAHNAPLDPQVRQQVKDNYADLRARAKLTAAGSDYAQNFQSALDVSEEERQRVFEERWAIGGFPFMGAFSDLMTSTKANEMAAEFVRAKIRGIVRDPRLAETLSPHNTFACKRLCVDTDYWATYNRENVQLVDVSRQPIEAITPDGIRANGTEYEVDAIVFATGFDAMTGALLDIDIRGRDGVTLRSKWAAGPRTHLGLTVAGFPNLFTITGPGSPSVLTNMLPAIEQHVDWIADCLAYLGERGLRRIEPSVEAEDAWVAHASALAGQSLQSTCGSWYIGANIPGKPRVYTPYVGGVPAYAQTCDAIAAKGYEGFVLS
jgi:cyclohexanone monooxygenase